MRVGAPVVSVVSVVVMFGLRPCRRCSTGSAVTEPVTRARCAARSNLVDMSSIPADGAEPLSVAAVDTLPDPRQHGSTFAAGTPARRRQGGHGIARRRGLAPRPRPALRAHPDLHDLNALRRTHRPPTPEGSTRCRSPSPKTTAPSPTRRRTSSAKRGSRGAARALLDGATEGRPAVLGRARRPRAGSACTCPRSTADPGFGLPELVVVVEELGRAVAPGPFVPTVIASAAARGQRRRRRQEASTCPGWPTGTTTGAVALGGSVEVARRHGLAARPAWCSVRRSPTCWS